MRRSLLLLAGLLGPGLVPVAAEAGVAETSVHTVTTTEDVVDAGDGLISLREAISASNADSGDSEIVLAERETYQLTFCGSTPHEHENVSGDLDADAGPGMLTITGNGATIEQTCDEERVLLTQRPITVRHLTVTGGSAPAGCCGESVGSGIYAYETVTAEDSLFTENVSSTGSGIYAGGTITALRSRFTDLTGTSGAPAIATVGADVTIVDSTVDGNVGGSNAAVLSQGDLTVRNTTISGNDAKASNINDSTLAAAGDLVLEHATVVDNTHLGLISTGHTLRAVNDLTITASIVVNGSTLPGGEPACLVEGEATSGGGNLVDDTSCGLDHPMDDQAVVDPMLDPLAGSGGPVPSHRPQAGSPAIDALPAAACLPGLAVDVRGVARPQAAGCDAGAVEVGVRPDAVVRLGNGTWRGDGVVGTTPVGQTRRAVVRRGRILDVRLRFDNDGELDEVLTIRGGKGRGRLTGRYRTGNLDRTAQVTGPGLVVPVDAGQSTFLRLRIRIAANAPHGLIRNFVVRVGAHGAGDRVRVAVRVR